MSVRTIDCPDCAYRLVYATLGAQGSYRTEASFAKLCRRKDEIRAHDALTCPTLRASAERLLGTAFPGRAPGA